MSSQPPPTITLAGATVRAPRPRPWLHTDDLPRLHPTLSTLMVPPPALPLSRTVNNSTTLTRFLYLFLSLTKQGKDLNPPIILETCLIFFIKFATFFAVHILAYAICYRFICQDFKSQLIWIIFFFFWFVVWQFSGILIQVELNIDFESQIL